MKKFTLALATSCLLINAKAQNVGIGTVAPTGPLTVIANDTAKGIVQKSGNTEAGFYTTTGGLAYVQTWSPNDLNLATGNGTAKITIKHPSGYIGINTTSPQTQLDINGGFRLRDNGAAAGKVLTSDATGNASWQTPAGSGVGFRAVLTTTVPLTNAAPYSLAGFTENFEDGGDNFNASTGYFTAPSAGVYRFDANLGWSSAPVETPIYYQARIYITIGGSSSIISQSGQPVTGISGYGINLAAGVTYKLNAGDQVHIEVSHTTANSISLNGIGGGSTATVFSGTKLY